MAITGDRFWGNLGPPIGKIFVTLLVLLCSSRCSYSELAAISVSGRPASQSSHLNNLYPASKAVDGQLATSSHTSFNDAHPWWLLDIGNKHCLGRITVTLRNCCNGYRFIAAVARAGPSANYAENQPCGSPATEAQSQIGAAVEFLCDPPRMARYVSLDINSSSSGVREAILQIAEVTVAGYKNIMCKECAINDDLSPTLKQINFERLEEGASVAGLNASSTEVAKSPPLCAVYCMVNTLCLSFAFSASNGQCYLYSLNSAEIEVTASDDFSVYVMTK